ncbi:DUF5658 family protein [Chloroflexota bacterium]
MRISLEYRTSRVRFQYLLLLLIGLILADGLMTELLVVNQLGQEANPIIGAFLDNGYHIAFKIVGALVATLILWDVHRRHPNLAFTSTLIFIAAYMGIVYWNIFGFIISSVNLYTS